LAAPLRGWLERSFRALFERETALYRDVVGRIGQYAGQYRSISELLSAIESETASALSLGRVKIFLTSPSTEDDLDQTPDPMIEELLRNIDSHDQRVSDDRLRP